MDAEHHERRRPGRLSRWGAACLIAAFAAATGAGAQTPDEPPVTAAPPSGEEAPSAAGATAEHEREAEVPATAPVEAEPPPEWNRPRPPLQGIDAQLHRLAVDLRLDEGQQQKIRPILVAQRDEAQRLQRDPQLKAPERHARLLALGDRTADQIRAQLTDEQRAQYVKPRSRSAVSGKAHAVRRPPAAAAAGATAGKDPK